MSGHDLIPLSLATRLVYLRAYGAAPPSAHLLSRLNGLAYSIAEFAAIYAMGATHEPPRQLSREELATGLFRGGGSELHFLDQRPALTLIGVTEEGIAKTVDALLASADL
jgi:hypothetical protein